MSIKEYKIQILSVLVMALAMFQVYPKNIINVSVYLEGDKANMATVVDLFLDYNENNLNLIWDKALAALGRDRWHPLPFQQGKLQYLYFLALIRELKYSFRFPAFLMLSQGYAGTG